MRGGKYQVFCYVCFTTIKNESKIKTFAENKSWRSVLGLPYENAKKEGPSGWNERMPDSNSKLCDGVMISVNVTTWVNKKAIAIVFFICNSTFISYAI